MHTFRPAVAQFLFHGAARKVQPGLVEKGDSLSGPETQIITGAVSAIFRNRSSLSRNRSMVARSSAVLCEYLFLELGSQSAEFEVRPNPSQQFLSLKRLGDVINRAQRQAFHSLFHLACRTNEHEWNFAGLFGGLESPADFKSVDARHANVQEDELR